MTDLIDVSGDALIFRRSDGTVLLNTNDRMPARTGHALYTGAMVWPNPSGAGIEARIASGGYEFRYKYPAGSSISTVVLGSAPSGYVPNFVLANVKFTRTTSTNIFGFVYASAQVPYNEWRSMGMSSVWVEYIRTSSANDAPIAHRHMTIDIEAGNWVLKLHESSRSYTSSWGGGLDGTGDAAATYNFDIEMAWGVFDL